MTISRTSSRTDTVVLSSMRTPSGTISSPLTVIVLSSPLIAIGSSAILSILSSTAGSPTPPFAAPGTGLSTRALFA